MGLKNSGLYSIFYFNSYDYGDSKTYFKSFVISSMEFIDTFELTLDSLN